MKLFSYLFPRSFKMSNKQQNISDFIKSVHKTLREKSKIKGPQKAWTEHCQKKEVLVKYANAMQKLATEYWEPNFNTNKNSRIIWVVENVEEYFRKGGLEYQRKREISVCPLESETNKLEFFNTKLALLDVGSCYNPFGVFDQLFEVTPIDIAPANEKVLQCDFLNVKIEDTGSNYDNNENTISRLKPQNFHVVLFSLLLEYLPSSEQRVLCCKNAYELLMPEGLLIIITPDSKHVGSNAKLMKSWRYALAALGFSRFKYEKLPHIHCMIFRKCLNKEFALRWTKIQCNSGFTGAINIPQDFNSDFKACDIFEKSSNDNIVNKDESVN